MATILKLDNRPLPPLEEKSKKDGSVSLLLSAHIAQALEKGIAAAGAKGDHPKTLRELIGFLAQMIGEFQMKMLEQTNKQLRGELAIGKRVNEVQEAAFQKQVKEIERQREKRKKRKGKFFKNVFNAAFKLSTVGLVMSMINNKSITGGLKAAGTEAGHDLTEAMGDEVTMKYLSYALLIGTCIACPALAPAAMTLFALEESGAMDKMCDQVAGDNHWGRLAFKIGVILAISAIGAGAGAATAKGAGMSAEREAARQGARQGARESAAASASTAKTFTLSNAVMSGAMAASATHPIVEFAQACGLKDEDALLALGIIESIMWMAAGMGAGYKGSKALAESGSTTRYIRLQTAAQEMLISPLLIGGLTQAFFQIGQGLERDEQAAVQKTLAKLSEKIELTKMAFAQSSDGLKQTLEETKGNFKTTHAMMDCIVDLLEPSKAVTRALSS